MRQVLRNYYKALALALLSFLSTGAFAQVNIPFIIGNIQITESNGEISAFRNNAEHIYGQLSYDQGLVDTDVDPIRGTYIQPGRHGGGLQVAIGDLILSTFSNSTIEVLNDYSGYDIFGVNQSTMTASNPSISVNDVELFLVDGSMTVFNDDSLISKCLELSSYFHLMVERFASKVRIQWAKVLH